MHCSTKNYLYLFILPLIIIAFACNKVSKPKVTDITKPVISISTPTTTSLFNSISPVNIVGTATDNDLAYQSVKVFDTTNHLILLNVSKNITGSGVTINESFSRAVTQTTPCLLEVVVNDVTGNTAKDSVFFNLY